MNNISEFLNYTSNGTRRNIVGLATHSICIPNPSYRPTDKELIASRFRRARKGNCHVLLKHCSRRVVGGDLRFSPVRYKTTIMNPPTRRVLVKVWSGDRQIRESFTCVLPCSVYEVIGRGNLLFVAETTFTF